MATTDMATTDMASPQPATTDYWAILERVINLDVELDLEPYRTAEAPSETPGELAAIARAAMALYLTERAEADLLRAEMAVLQDARARARAAIKIARDALMQYRDGYRGNAEADDALAQIAHLGRAAGTAKPALQDGLAGDTNQHQHTTDARVGTVANRYKTIITN